jgi:hypothetical protein
MLVLVDCNNLFMHLPVWMNRFTETCRCDFVFVFLYMLREFQIVPCLSLNYMNFFVRLPVEMWTSKHI